jgi:hypothetical protein
VQQHDQVAAYGAPGVDRERQARLLDDLLRGEKGLAAFVDGRGDELPDQQPDGEKRQVARHVHREQLRIDAAHRGDHDQGTEREPKRPQQRTAITQLEIVERQRPPGPALGEAL